MVASGLQLPLYQRNMGLYGSVPSITGCCTGSVLSITGFCAASVLSITVYYLGCVPSVTGYFYIWEYINYQKSYVLSMLHCDSTVLAITNSKHVPSWERPNMLYSCKTSVLIWTQCYFFFRDFYTVSNYQEPGLQGRRLITTHHFPYRFSYIRPMKIKF